MYIRRKIFSLSSLEYKLFSTNGYTLRQKEFAKNKKKKAYNRMKYIEIDQNKAIKAGNRAEVLKSAGDINGAALAQKKSDRFINNVNTGVANLSDRVDNLSKTHKSIDSAQGWSINRQGAINDTTMNFKRDLPNNQSTFNSNVVSRHDTIPGTNQKVSKQTTVTYERRVDKPISTANPYNATTNSQAKQARQNRRKQNAPIIDIKTTSTGYTGGVNNKPVVKKDKVVTQTSNVSKGNTINSITSSVTNTVLPGVTATTNLVNQTKPKKPYIAPSTGIKPPTTTNTTTSKTNPGFWNSMGTVGKVGTVAAGITATGLLAKGLFGGKKKEED